jgi:predicted ATPase
LLALIEWSHDLLSDAERTLLRRLAVFAGSFSLQAAQAVCGEGLGEDVLETLARLADKSLVEVGEPVDADEGRFRLLETIRQYAREKLLEAGEAEAIRDRHLDFFLRFAEQTEPKLHGAEQLARLARVEREHDNLRIGLAWALERGASESESALRLVGALAYFWELRGYWSEGHTWLTDALALAERAQAGRIAARESDAPPRAEAARRAKALYGAARLHFAARFEPNISRAMAEESLRVWREVGDMWWMAVALEHVGFMLSAGGDVQTARARLEEGVSLAREVEDRWPLAVCLVRLCSFLPLTEHATARQIRAEAVAVARSVGDKSVLSQGLFGLATDHVLEGNLTAAAPIAEEALAEARAIGSVMHVILSLLVLVTVSCLQDDLANANRYGFQALALAQETGAPQWLFLMLLAFGLVACFGDQPLRGVRLLVASDTLLRQRGINISVEGMRDLMVIKQAFDAALETARAQLDPATLAAAWAEGEQLTVEQAMALATETVGADTQIAST